LVQAVAAPKEPFAWQVSVLLPAQVVWPGAQVPVHAPETQVWLLHVVPTVQVPEELHVSVWLEPEQLI
jgi:hypothetical protein